MSRTSLGAVLALLALGLLTPLAARATTATCPQNRANIEAAVESGEPTDQISETMASCLLSPISGAELSAPYNQSITNPGGSNTSFEAIEACGYNPQRKEATCPIQIRQPTGFGGMICAASGSWEFVLLCVDFGAGLVPINVNGFHVYDSTLAPNWDFAAVIQSNATLMDQQYTGQALPARAILSWMVNPMVGPVPCNFVPTWGNRSDFRIRLDP
jgi:hypothetical protein